MGIKVGGGKRQIYTRTVRKIGNSVLIALPAQIVREMGLEVGDSVKVSNKNGYIQIRKKGA